MARVAIIRISTRCNNDLDRSGETVIARRSYDLIQIIFRCVIQTLDGNGTIFRGGHHKGRISRSACNGVSIARFDQFDQISGIGKGIVFAKHVCNLQIAVLGEDKLCTLQSSLSRAINLGHIDLESPVMNNALRGVIGRSGIVGIVAVFQPCFVVLMTVRSYKSRFVQNTRERGVQFVTGAHKICFLRGLHINSDRELVAGSSNSVVGRRQFSAFSGTDVDSNNVIRIAADYIGSDLRVHLVVDLVGIGAVALSVGYGGDSTEVDCITDLVVANGTPRIGLIVLDLLGQSNRSILSSNGCIGYDVQHITAVSCTIGQINSGGILDKIVTVCKAADGISSTVASGNASYIG